MTAPERRSTAPPLPAAPASEDLDGLHAELVRIREELATRDARISRLGRTVAQLEERCAGLRQQLAARDEQLERRAEENRRYATDLSGGRDEIARLSAEVGHLVTEVRELHASTSWRVTGPLRGLKNALLRLQSTLRRTPPVDEPPSPAAPPIENPDVTLIARSGLFDPDHYASQVPGLRERGVDLVTHYLTRGAAEGLDPNPVFDSSFYLERYPAVASSGENPLVHYLREGAAERRDPHPLFETSFYLEQKPHVAALGVNPLAHFLAEGPTPAFDPLSVPPPVPDTGICIVTPDVVGPVKNGGIGTACYHFARILARDGHPVTVLFTCDLSPCRGAHWRNTYARMGIGFVPLEDTPPVTHEVIGSNWFMDRSWRVYEYLKRARHSVIHFQDWHANGFWSIKAKRVGLAFDRTTLTVMTHSPTKWQDDGMQQFGPEPIETAKLVWAESYAIEHCDVLLSPTRYMLDWLSQNGFRRPESVIVTPNSYTENTEPPDRPGDVDNDHLIFFGRLETRKGLYVFGEALRRLRYEGLPLPHTVSFLGTLVTVNGRPAAEYLDRLREDMAPIEIRVIDTLDHAGAREYIARTRGLVVLPSLVDNCPFVVIESIENGLPFIAARTGGIPDMVDPKATFEPTIEGLAGMLAARHGIDHVEMRHPYSVRAAMRIWRDLHGEDGTFGHQLQGAPLPLSSSDAIPRVSVCIRFFEQQRHLEALVAALADQCYPDLEVVVVNDGSSREASREFDRVANSSRDERFRFLTTEHRGPGAVRNTAAASATGELLAFFECDSLPKTRDVLLTLVRALRGARVDCLACAYDVIRADQPTQMEQDVVATYRPWGACLEAGFVENVLGSSTMIIRSSVFAQLGGFSRRRPSWEAHEFLLRLCFNGFTLETFPEALLYSRLGRASGNQADRFLRYQSLFELLQRAPSRELARILAVVGGPTLVARLVGRGRPVAR
jgi:glycosyltransferase involved in cell wall biosynthesis